MMKRSIFVGLVSMSAVQGAHGAPILVYEGTAVLETVFGPASDLEVGQECFFSLSLDRDLGSTDQNPAGDAGLYSFSDGFEYVISVPDASFEFTITNGVINTFNNAGSGGNIDTFGINANNVSSLTLRDDQGEAFSSDAIPTIIPLLSNFELIQFGYNSPGFTPGFIGQVQTFTVSELSTCPADLNNDGSVNFFDVSAFLLAFTANEPIADVNGDGMWNFFDVSLFLQQFTEGCP
tara:strand:- start:300 stop:1004 length:705 start_codon:yes stop_codon:yes gene_type:complete